MFTYIFISVFVPNFLHLPAFLDFSADVSLLVSVQEQTALWVQVSFSQYLQLYSWLISVIQKGIIIIIIIAMCGSLKNGCSPSTVYMYAHNCIHECKAIKLTACGCFAKSSADLVIVKLQKCLILFWNTQPQKHQKQVTK